MTIRTRSRALMAILALGVLLLPAGGAQAQGPGVENGQWTYLGGDAWHTRYTPADEITRDSGRA